MISDTEIALDDLANVVDGLGVLGSSQPNPTISWSFRVGAPQVGFVQSYIVPYDCHVVSVSCSTSSVIVSFDGRAATGNLMTDSGLIYFGAVANAVEPNKRIRLNHGQTIYFFAAAQTVINMDVEPIPLAPPVLRNPPTQPPHRRTRR